MFNKLHGNKKRKMPFWNYLVKKSRKNDFVCQKLTSFHYMAIASAFSQISLRIVHKKMPDIYLSETFFRIWLSLLLLELRRHQMLQTRWNILQLHKTGLRFVIFHQTSCRLLKCLGSASLQVIAFDGTVEPLSSGLALTYPSLCRYWILILSNLVSSMSPLAIIKFSFY